MEGVCLKKAKKLFDDCAYLLTLRIFCKYILWFFINLLGIVFVNTVQVLCNSHMFW